MGYESRIYVVEKFSHTCFDESGKRSAREIAVIDMCRCYNLADKLRNCPKTDCYIYADDGETIILEDRYGEELTECSIPKAIEFLEKAMVADNYWRYNILHAMLTEFAKYDHPDLAVLHYGY
jgi:hypothetical protein